MGEPARQLHIDPVPRYSLDHYKDQGAIDERFRPPLRHLAVLYDLDDVKIDNVVDLREAAARLRQLHISQSREDFRCFLEYCYTDPVTRKPFEIQFFQEEAIEVIEGEKKSIVILPRDSGKTSIVIAYIVWRLGRNQNLRVKILCADDATAIKRLKAVKRGIEQNRRIREVFPELEPDRSSGWADRSIFVKRSIIDPEPSVEAKGIKSSVTGSRTDLLVADDIVSLENAIQKPGERQKVKDKWEDNLFLCHKDSQIIYICTLYHRDDNSHEVRSSGAYKEIFYGIKNYDSIWPDREPESVLREKRTTMSATAWARGKKNEPMADSDRLIREVWFEWVPINIQQMIKDGWIFFQSYDVATQRGKKNDFFASCTSAVNPQTKEVVIVDAWHDKLTKSQQAKMVFIEYQRYKSFRILIEIVGQESLDQRVLEMYPELVGVVEKVTPGQSKPQRLDAVTPFLENGHVKFAEHLNPDGPKFNPARGNLFYELVEFPADHDDLADSFSQNLDGVRRYFLDQYPWMQDNQEVQILAF
jgi:phage terminase large subunit-like protein